MSRRGWFGGSVADWTFRPGDDDYAQLVGDVTVTFWNAEVGGSRHTDLLAADGSPITQVVSSDGGDGREVGTIPPFQGPEGILYMWAQGGDGPRVLIHAWDVGDLAAAAVAQAESAEAMVSELSTDLGVLKTQGLVVVMETGGGGYPPLPPGFGLALYVGANPPPSSAPTGTVWLQPEASS